MSSSSLKGTATGFALIPRNPPTSITAWALNPTDFQVSPVKQNERYSGKADEGLERNLWQLCVLPSDVRT